MIRARRNLTAVRVRTPKVCLSDLQDGLPPDPVRTW